MALSLTPTQSGLLPIVIEPGVALTLGRLSNHGIERCKECRQVSRSQCIFSLRDGRLHAQNVGKGLVRAHRGGAAAGDSHLVEEMGQVELLAGDLIDLVVMLEDGRSESVVASWQVPTRDAWPSVEPQGAEPPAPAPPTDVKPEQLQASGNPPALALPTDARLPARTPLTAQPPGCKRVAMTPLTGELPSRHQPCESEPPLVSPQAPQPPQQQPPQPPQPPQQMQAPPSHSRLPATAATAASVMRGLRRGGGASEGAIERVSEGVSEGVRERVSDGASGGGGAQAAPAGQVLLGGAHAVLLAQLSAAVESTVANVLQGWECQPGQPGAPERVGLGP